jgi:hypothetical protein
VNHFAKYENGSFSSALQQPSLFSASDQISDLLALNSTHVFVVGTFTKIGNVSVSNVALLENSQISNSFAVRTGPVYSIALLPDGELLIGGSFQISSHECVGNIAVSGNGSQSNMSSFGLRFQPVGVGVEGQVNAIVSHPTDTQSFYIGGKFVGTFSDDVGSFVVLNNIALYNASNIAHPYSSLINGTNGGVLALAVHQASQ